MTNKKFKICSGMKLINSMTWCKKNNNNIFIELLFKIASPKWLAINRYINKRYKKCQKNNEKPLNKKYFDIDFNSSFLNCFNVDLNNCSKPNNLIFFNSQTTKLLKSILSNFDVLDLYCKYVPHISTIIF